MKRDEMEKWHQKFLVILAGFRLLDDDFMTAAFQDHLECVDLVLQIILDRPDIKATKAITQHTLKNLHGRSVRLDIHAWTDEQEFNVEIQRGGKGAAERRARYNSSLMDANTLLSGDDYASLPESYVIFITETDVLGMGQPIYVVERMVRGSDRTFQDGSHIIYVNSSMTDETTPLGRLMHDFRCANPDEMYYDVLAERTGRFKKTEEGESTMNAALDALIRDVSEERVAEALERGMERERISAIRRMMTELQLSVEKAMSVLAIPQSEWGRYKAML